MNVNIYIDGSAMEIAALALLLQERQPDDVPSEELVDALTRQIQEAPPVL